MTGGRRVTRTAARRPFLLWAGGLAVSAGLHGGALALALSGPADLGEQQSAASLVLGSVDAVFGLDDGVVSGIEATPAVRTLPQPANDTPVKDTAAVERTAPEAA